MVCSTPSKWPAPECAYGAARERARALMCEWRHGYVRVSLHVRDSNHPFLPRIVVGASCFFSVHAAARSARRWLSLTWRAVVS